MSKDRYWRAISIDSISPELFPKIALYLRSGENYVLYKNPDRMFTVEDSRRLKRNLTEFLYVRSGDMEVLNEFLEKNLREALERDDLSSTSKGKMLYQCSINCVIDLFEEPESSLNIQRCCSMVEAIMHHMATDQHALESLQSIAKHNFYIFAHSVQVAALSLMVHDRLFELAPDEMLDVGIGSLVHDYGMIFISSEVLDKNDALADVEYFKIKQHTQKGYDFLKQTGKFCEVALNIIRYHHERYDGNGFPTGLKRDDIPRSGQVSALCDMYSSLLLKTGKKHSDAIKVMREEGRKGAYNPDLLDKFVSLLTEQQ